jgi:hypothetical protein
MALNLGNTLKGIGSLAGSVGKAVTAMPKMATQAASAVTQAATNPTFMAGLKKASDEYASQVPTEAAAPAPQPQAMDISQHVTPAIDPKEEQARNETLNSGKLYSDEKQLFSMMVADNMSNDEAIQQIKQRRIDIAASHDQLKGSVTPSGTPIAEDANEEALIKDMLASGETIKDTYAMIAQRRQDSGKDYWDYGRAAPIESIGHEAGRLAGAAWNTVTDPIGSGQRAADSVVEGVLGGAQQFGEAGQRLTNRAMFPIYNEIGKATGWLGKDSVSPAVPGSNVTDVLQAAQGITSAAASAYFPEFTAIAGTPVGGEVLDKTFSPVVNTAKEAAFYAGAQMQGMTYKQAMNDPELRKQAEAFANTVMNLAPAFLNAVKNGGAPMTSFLNPE